MKSVIYIIVQIMVIILVAPFVNGIINKVKAFSQKRKGAPLFQMYFDLYKLFNKQTVISDVSSWIFKVTPYIVLATAVVAALLVPVTTLLTPMTFPGDIIVMVSLFALGRFFMVIAGLDTGSSFGGLGSSRETMISSLIEPSILISVFTVALIAKSTSIFIIMNTMKDLNTPLAHSVFIMEFLSMLIVIIAETSRIPIDDPATHLELTMTHEAMLLEYSGRHLALMQLGMQIKQLVFITLLVNIFVPLDQLITFTGFAAVVVSILLYVIKVVFISILIAIIEISTVRVRFFSIPNLAAMSFILAFIGFLQYFVLGR